MPRATELAHLLLSRSIRPGDCVVDATVGNGHDTLFLAQCVGASGCVIGFDVQETAIEAAARRLGDHPQVTLICKSHEHLSVSLPDDARGRLAAVMFNLGYLPGAEKTITTRAETTLAALEQALAEIKAGGVVTLIVYPGHPGGAEEADAVRSHAENLPPMFSASSFLRLNARSSAPGLVTIERLE